MSTPDAGFKRILLCCPGHEPIHIPCHPRNYHAPVHLRHEIDAVRLVVEANDPRAGIALGAVALTPGKESEPLPLACGRNAFTGRITSSDGQATSEFHLRFFRAYPHPAWEKVADTAPWAPRDSAGELVFRDRMWLLGGYIPNTTNDVWSSADGVAWTREGDVPTPRGLDIPIAFVLNDRMWVTDLDGVLFSSPDGRTWSMATDQAPCRGRRSVGCAVFDGRVWLMGGTKGEELMNDVWSSPDGVTWTQQTPHAPWCGRQVHHAPVVLNDRLWLLGGSAFRADYYPFVAWNDVWSSADGVHWEQTLDHAPWVPRIWGASAVYRDRMWVIGGFRSEPVWENLGDVWYSSDGATWRQFEAVPSVRHSGFGNAPVVLPGAMWAPRHEHSTYTLGDALWVVAGMVWPLMNDVWRLRLPGLCFISQPVSECYAGGRYEYAARADFNARCRPVRYRLTRGPAWLKVDEQTGRLCGTPPRAEESTVLLEARDTAGETAQQEYALHVLPCK